MSYAKAGTRIGDQTVQPNCDDTTFGGYWFCVPHGPLQHNLAAARHADDTDCQLAWWCFGHDQLEQAD